MIGRDAERVAILSRLRTGTGAVIVGDAGVGKSTLARAIAAQLRGEGWRAALVLCGGRADLASPAVREVVAHVGRTLLVVDDAHLLDEDSASMLWRLVAADQTQIVATVRAGVATPDAVARLWTCGICERFDLGPLTVADIRQLLEEVLGGDVDDRLVQVVIEQAAGNALLVRELVRCGVDAGSIQRSHQVWRLAGELPVGRPVADLIRATLAGLDEAEVTGSQLLALAKQLPIRVAAEVIDQDVLETLEAKRIVIAQPGIHGTVVTLAHPLYGEVIRAELPPIRARRLQLELITAIERTTPVGDHDRLRCALWRLDLDEPVAVADLLQCARIARAVAPATAERLARAAANTATDPSTAAEATIVLTEILLMQGRVAEVDPLLDALPNDMLEETHRQRVTAARALGRTRLGQLADAATLLATPGEASSLQLQALHAQALMLDGRLDQCAAIARPVFTDSNADPVARAYAAFTLAARATFAGAITDTEPVLHAALPLATATRAAVPYGIATVQVSSVIALAGAGRLDAAQALAQQMQEDALREDDPWLLPRAASGLGVVALLRGKPRTALKHFRATVAALNDFDGLFLRYNLSYLARAAAAAGLTDEAQQALAPPPEAPEFAIFGPDWHIAEAATLAAAGDLPAAIERALHAARTAAALGAWMPALVAAHDAVRYGGASQAGELVTTAAAQVDADLPRCLADHARARAADDSRQLAAVSERFEAIGTLQYAAEAAYAAAHAFRSQGDSRAAARASVRATALHADCEQAAIGWVATFHAAALTRREEQVALLAAAGHPDTAIANQLAISPRTVQTHLLRVYYKLNITGRHDLPGALTSTHHPTSGVHELDGENRGSSTS